MSSFNETGHLPTPRDNVLRRSAPRGHDGVPNQREQPGEASGADNIGSAPQLDRARRAVARGARDPQDRALLLAMLGLDKEDERPPTN